MKHIDLFAGIGGFSLAARWMGWETIAHCEINPFCQKVLQHHFPKSEKHYDIRETDFTPYRGTNGIVTGGFPCQPYSNAGKRLGKNDDRHLWPEMLRAIRESEPLRIVGENVRGLISWDGGLVFDEVQSDLEAIGYETIPFLLPACGVGAPHRRDRIWFIATNTKNDRHARGTEFNQRNSGELYTGEQRFNETHGSESFGRGASAADPKGLGQKRPGSSWDRGYGFTNSDSRPIANANSDERREGGLHASGPEKAERHAGSFHACGYERRTWENFPTVGPLCERNDGLSIGLSGITFSKWRNEGIKAMGNSVVPQVVYQIFKAIEQYEIFK